MFGRFFDTTPVDTFAGWVVAELRKSLPPERVASDSKQTAKQREQFDARVRRQADQMVSATRLNIYQKAVLGNRLQDKLLAAGYADTFSRPFAGEVVRLVAIAAAQPR